MKIKLDKSHTLISDQYCYWITETVITKTKAYTRRASGYTATLEQCFDSYIDKKIKSSEASEIGVLAKEVKALKEQVKGWCAKLCQ